MPSRYLRLNEIKKKDSHVKHNMFSLWDALHLSFIYSDTEKYSFTDRLWLISFHENVEFMIYALLVFEIFFNYT